MARTWLKITTIFLILLASQTQLPAQDSSLVRLEEELVSLFKKRQAAIFSDKRDSIFDAFDSKMQQLFNHPHSCTYSFDSLASYIKITKVDDQAIRIFSWDDLGGGSFHTYTNFLQYTSARSCKVIPFDTSENDLEVGYYDIKIVEEAKNTWYLLFGYGTYGSGKHHRVVRIFQNIKDSLLECFSCYPQKEPWILFSNRSQNIELYFDPEQYEISYKEFEYDDNNGFFTDKFNLVRWRFKKGKWKKE